MVSIISLWALFGFGTAVSLLGSISIRLMQRLQINESQFGTLVSILTLVCVGTSIFLGVLSDIVGFQPMIAFGFFMSAGAFLIIARSRQFLTVAFACALIGLGAMTLNIIGNTLAMVTLYDGQNTAAATNVSNIFFGLGLFLTPIITSTMFRRASYELSISLLSLLFFLPGLMIIPADFPQLESGFALADAIALLKDPNVLLAGLTLFFYVAMESSYINWLPKIGSEILAKENNSRNHSEDESKSMRVLSIFAIFLMLGRLVASQIPSITAKGEIYIIIAAVISAVLILLLRQTSSMQHGRILAGAAGFTFAPIFPTIVGVTFATYETQVYGSLFGILGAIALLGAVIAPKTIGVLAKQSSVQKSLYLLLPACGILIILASML